MIQLKQQPNRILETAFGVGKHSIGMTGHGQQKVLEKGQRRAGCGSGLFILPPIYHLPPPYGQLYTK